MIPEEVVGGVFCEKGVLKNSQYSQENTCVGLLFCEYSCEYCEYFEEHLRTAAFRIRILSLLNAFL